MFDHEIRISKQMLHLLKGIVKDIDEAHFTVPVPGAKNPPAYILCHLAVANDGALRLLGQPPLCPPEWRGIFGPGGNPDAVPLTYPSKIELVELLERGHAAICQAAVSASTDEMRQPHGIPFLAASPIQTKAEAVALLLTGHFSFHSGQLSLMRRQLGFAPVF
jgi:hypothetical protein